MGSNGASLINHWSYSNGFHNTIQTKLERTPIASFDQTGYALPIGFHWKPDAICFPKQPLSRSPFFVIYGQTAFAVAPLIVLYAFGSREISNPDLLHQLNGYAPIYFVFVMLVAAVRIARHCPEAIWTPAFWILMNSAVFYGIGPLVEVYGNSSTRAALLHSELAVSPAELTRSNLLSTSGITCLITGFWLHICANPGKWKPFASPRFPAHPSISPVHIAVAFVLGGAMLRYLFIKPAQWGVIDMVVPGVLTSVAPILDVGFGMMAYLVARGSPSLRYVITICLPVHLLLTLLSMSKMELVIALVFPALGAYLGNARLSRLALSMTVIASVFVPAQDLVHFGRAAILERSGSINDAGYLERTDIFISYLSRQPDPVVHSSIDPRQGWWTRLNFSGEQALAMALHDAGAAGSTLSNAWIRFVPRMLWPDKPIIRPLGAEFYNISVNRQGTSNLGLPIYGDLYWNYGWTGVVVGCLLIGWLFAGMSWRSIDALKKMEFVVLPAVLIAMLSAAQGINNFVLDSIISRLPIYFAYLFAAGLLIKYLRSKRYTLEGPIY